MSILSMGVQILCKCLWSPRRSRIAEHRVRVYFLPLPRFVLLVEPFPLKVSLLAIGSYLVVSSIRTEDFYPSIRASAGV